MKQISVLRQGRIKATHPLDFLRRRKARGLEVGTTHPGTRRGEGVEALVTINSLDQTDDVEVGLVCTEYFDLKVHTQYDSHRETADTILHEEWVPVEHAPGVQSARFTVPPEAPFSYEGQCLSFRWEVVARRRSKLRFDAQVKHEISIAP